MLRHLTLIALFASLLAMGCGRELVDPYLVGSYRAAIDGANAPEVVILTKSHQIDESARPEAVRLTMPDGREFLVLRLQSKSDWTIIERQTDGREIPIELVPVSVRETQ